MIFETFSFEDTYKIGFNLAKKAKKGDIFCLVGEIGAGKTQFAKGFASGLNIKETITSPTFNIVNQYSSDKLMFFHFDVYRFESFEQMYDIGYEEYFFGDGICLIEWADIIKEIIPNNAIWVYIKKNNNKNENFRSIEVKNENFSY